MKHSDDTDTLLSNKAKQQLAILFKRSLLLLNFMTLILYPVIYSILTHSKIIRTREKRCDLNVHPIK